MYLGAMGVSFADLPRGGQNLRLYINYPPGSPQATPPLVGNPNGCRTTAGCFMTGHYDISLPGGPCSQSDPQEFPSWAAMSQYAGTRGEMLALVGSDSEVNALCSYRPPAAPAAPPVPPPQPGGPPIIVQQPAPGPGPDLTIKVPVRPSTPAPGQPIIITTPGGGGGGYPIYTPTPGPAPDSGLSTPLVIGAAAVLLLLARR
jgi:hypothetical protein